jgi:hypothetical protein
MTVNPLQKTKLNGSNFSEANLETFQEIAKATDEKII